MKFLLDDSDAHIGGHRAPDWLLHRVLAGAQEFLDSQVLLDPLGEQFHVPAVLVQGSDSQRRQRRVVGQEDQVLSRLWVLETHAPQMLGVIPANIMAIHGNQLIPDDSGSAVSSSRINPPSIPIALGPHDKEGACLMHLVESGGIHVATIDHVEGTRVAPLTFFDSVRSLPRHKPQDLRESQMSKLKFKSWTPINICKPASMRVLQHVDII